MKTKKYFYRKVLLSTICTGSIIGYFVSNSKILGSAPSSDFSYLHIEAMNYSEDQTIVGMDAQADVIEVNDVDNESIAEASVGEINETIIENTPEAESEEEQESVYVVQEGQTLWEISQEIDVSIQDLIQENNLSNGVVAEGQELLVD